MNENNVLLLSSFQWNTGIVLFGLVWIADKQNDSSISLESSFQWNTGIVRQVKCCYRFVISLSWVLWIADSAQMSNKMITTVYLQNDSSISLEWSLLWNTWIVLQANCCYHFDMKGKQWNAGIMITAKRCFHCSICFGP